MPLIEVESSYHFKELLKSSPDFILVDFSAKWCGPCKRIEPKLKEFSEKYPLITFLKVDVDKNEELVQTYGITSMPTFLVFERNNKTPQYKPIQGADAQKVENMLRMLSGEKYRDDDF